ncbi:MAG: hypothetical protein P4L31_02720 [Candidatus Babeliales bacterium]|nr:hypothetical protein [Candidatus Babeliales bacterium]
MHKKAPLYKWIILLLIPLIGIAFILYRKASHHPATSEYNAPQEQPITESAPEEPSDNFFNYTEPEDTQIAPEKKPIEVVQPAVKKPEKTPIKKDKEASPKKEKMVPAQKPINAKQKEEVKQTEKIPAAQEAPKEIQLILDMTKKNLAYKYLFVHYSPSKWILKLDGTPVLTFDGKHLTQVKNSISINPEKPIAARFDFEFLGGRRLGWKEVMYQIDKNVDAIHINFDWKDPEDDQILISPAKALSKKGHNNHTGAE